MDLGDFWWDSVGSLKCFSLLSWNNGLYEGRNNVERHCGNYFVWMHWILVDFEGFWLKMCRELQGTTLSCYSIVFMWFELGCVIWAQMSQISASQIKAPVGSVFWKFVYSSFMVKMRIDFRSFGLFWLILGWGWCVRKESVKFEFWGFWGQKVQIWNCRKMGCWCRYVSISQKVQIFGERSILMKCSALYGGLRGSIQF